MDRMGYMTLPSVLDIVISRFCIAYSIASQSSFSRSLVNRSLGDTLLFSILEERCFAVVRIEWTSYLVVILLELFPPGWQGLRELGPARWTPWIAKIQQLKAFMSCSFFKYSTYNASGKGQLGRRPVMAFVWLSSSIEILP